MAAATRAAYSCDSRMTTDGRHASSVSSRAGMALPAQMPAKISPTEIRLISAGDAPCRVFQIGSSRASPGWPNGKKAAPASAARVENSAGAATPTSCPRRRQASMKGISGRKWLEFRREVKRTRMPQYCQV